MYVIKPFEFDLRKTGDSQMAEYIDDDGRIKDNIEAASRAANSSLEAMKLILEEGHGPTIAMLAFIGLNSLAKQKFKGSEEIAERVERLKKRWI